jgi:DNA-binding CsgD family transcriptional regulator
MKKIKSLGLVKGVITKLEQETIEDIFKSTIPPDGFGIFMANAVDTKQADRWNKFISEFISDPEVVGKFHREYLPVFENSNHSLDRILRYHLNNNGKVNAPQALTFRQEQIARLIKSQGMSVKQLSNTLKISEATVKLHTGIIMKKFGVQNRTQLVVAMNNFG